MALPASAAWWFLLIAVPVGLWVAYTDLSRMKITNAAVVALFAGYAVLGLLALPLQTYLWGYAHLAVVLVIGIIAERHRRRRRGRCEIRGRRWRR